MRLNELHKYIQEFHSVGDLDNALSEIFGTKEANCEDIREKKGPHGRLFKLAGEELGPLIEWMQIHCPDGEGQVIDGSQSFDAKVRMPDTGEVIRLEIGFATDGYQEALRAELISQQGHAGAFDDLERVSKGKSKSVEVRNEKIAQSLTATVEKLLKTLDCLAKIKDNKENYKPSMTLLLFLDNDHSLKPASLDLLKAGAEEILRRHDWVFEQVDVVCPKYGRIASWAKSGRHDDA